MRIKVSEQELLEAGYRKVYIRPGDAQEQVAMPGESRLRNLKKGQKIKPRRVRARRRALNEAELIGLMQSSAIGRPATYVVVMDTLLRRGYASRDRDGALLITGRGQAVLTFLLAEFPDLFSLDFTRQLEAQLDHIASKINTYDMVIKKFVGMIGNPR